MKLSYGFRECFTCEFQHFEFEIYTIVTYPDYFGSENCIFRDRSTTYQDNFTDTMLFFTFEF